MPLSHNLVEAMSVGCIPLTQYGDFFDPPLRDGVDCIAHGGTDIVDRARAVLAMDDARVETLRRNVIAYYERYLSVDAFIRRVLEHPGQRGARRHELHAARGDPLRSHGDCVPGATAGPSGATAWMFRRQGAFPNRRASTSIDTTNGAL